MTNLNVEIDELTIDQLNEVTGGEGNGTHTGGGGGKGTGVEGSTGGPVEIMQARWPTLPKGAI